MSEPVRAKKSLGQNFLTDPNIQRKIVTALDASAGDSVVEIGPGLGALTAHLVDRVQRLVAIELDDELAARLEKEYGSHAGFTLVHQNVLEVDFARLELPTRYKVIGNIPYNITTPLLFKLLEPEARPALMIVMVQKEVAQRITARPGGRDYGALTVGVQAVARAERLFSVGRSAFRPSPNVDSAVLKITPIQPAPLSRQEERDLRTLTRTLFGQRRKQLQTILRRSPVYQLAADDIEEVCKVIQTEPMRRPEELQPLQFIGLARALRALGRPAEVAA